MSNFAAIFDISWQDEILNPKILFYYFSIELLLVLEASKMS